MLTGNGRQLTQCPGFFLGWDWRVEPIYSFCLWSPRRRAVKGGDGEGGCNVIRFAVSKSLFWSVPWRAWIGGGPEWIQEDWLGRSWCLLTDSLRPIHAFLCPLVNVDVNCIDVGTGDDLFFCCLLWLISFVNSKVIQGGDSVLCFFLCCKSLWQQKHNGYSDGEVRTEDRPGCHL